MWGKRERSAADRTITVTLGPAETTLLATLLDELDELTDTEVPPTPGDRVSERLFPPGYGDPADAADFSDLTRTSLAQERRARYGQCRTELPDPAGELVIAADATQRWLMSLNDMRLALGTRLGVTADGFDDGRDGDDADHPQYSARIAYYWLTAMQDGLLSRISD